MPLFKTITVPEGVIGVWQLTEKIADLLPDFTIEELKNPDFQKYSFEKRKVEWLATRRLIKELIGPEFEISYLETGKPILNHSRYKYISISHSQEFAVVFVHEILETGIDIEAISRNYNPVEKRYLSEDELIQVNRNQTLQCLYWCAKEAVFKFVHDDGVEFKKQIHISPFDPEYDSHFTARFISDDKESSYQLHFQIFEGHGMVWVSGKNE
jgi:4'-phosphopantetheinyl transferase